jgi:hypothetical protein
MISRFTRLALSLGLAVSLGVASVPLGCGGSEEAFYAVPQPRKDPEVPEHVAKQLEGCLKQTSAAFPPAEGSTYAVAFNVQVSKGGSVHAVEVKDSTLGGHEVEACFGRVLQGMTLPRRTIAMGLEDAPPRGAAAPTDPALVGQAIAIPNPFSLLPVVLTVAAVHRRRGHRLRRERGERQHHDRCTTGCHSYTCRVSSADRDRGTDRNRLSWNAESPKSDLR